MTYTALPCPRCHAPAGKSCTDRRGVTVISTCKIRVREADNAWLSSLGYGPIKGPVE